MRDILLEETVEIAKRDKANKKYNLFNVLTIFLYVGCFLWFLVVTVNSLDPTHIDFYIFGIIPNVILLVGAIFLGKARDSFYVEYDYRFLTGEITISKVIKAKKRKNGIQFKCSELEKLGIYASEDYFKFENIDGIKKLIMTSNTEPSAKNGFFYAVFNRADEKYLVVMECSRQFISLVISYSNRFIVEEELKKI